MNRIVSVLAAASLSAFATASLAQQIPDYVAKAVADPGRSQDAANDARRKVAELVAFSGAKPGDKVVDLIPGSGYFTRVFSKVVGPTGHVYAVWPEPYDNESHPDSDRLRALAKQPGYGNISVAIQPAAHLSSACW